MAVIQRGSLLCNSGPGVENTPELDFSGGAKGIRTPDLLDANETRYQLRHSP
jgi:hypothetical protein